MMTTVWTSASQAGGMFILL